jgi:glycosyltransferase involved in cell wall biosynthesis
MNILFLNSLGKAKWGGGEKWMIKAGEELKKRGHTATIACLRNSVIEQKALEKKLDIFHFGIPADIAFWQMSSLKKFLKTHKIDVLICCQNKDVKIGGRAAKQIGLKAVFARQGIQNLSNKKKYIVPFTKYIDGIITNTQSIKKIYESYGWFPQDFIHVIYNGVDTDKEAQSVDLIEKYSLPAGCKTIFSAGRLDYQKGFDLLIEVAVKAKNQSLNWQFIIAGEGKLMHELTELAEKKGVSESVRFIGFTHEVNSLLIGADVFILPSRYEGMPNALLEAMAMGKASVATSVNGAPELAEDGISCFLVESEKTDQMFNRLSELLTDESLRKKMGLNAFRRVQRNFTFDKMADQLEQLFYRFVKT